ncbi:Peroxisomal membrane 22 kDa (Mpv17/PMP22) family protein [Zostera marina]|uniref:Peroxisomal membrane 22 kDa (Mpv17/PMP22) family protein n=1 Tax=Zostera marina TaxID=29655 RepID=A0A0K9NHF1_ZOSMR|nr:Peroxisomal membrane 22 kDa (Mpv17/PMP22) family protein [Zostera marina]
MAAVGGAVNSIASTAVRCSPSWSASHNNHGGSIIIYKKDSRKNIGTEGSCLVSTRSRLRRHRCVASAAVEDSAEMQNPPSLGIVLENGEGGGDGDNNPDKLADRVINATVVLAAGTFAITKLLTIDQDYWHGWTLFEILRYAPQHNWIAYEDALKKNPVLAKMMISGVVYSVGDWIAQCFEGKPLLEFDRSRLFRSGIVGFTLHGSLSHYYYYFCETIFPSEGWWVVPAKVVFDQTVWAAIWNSIYFIVLGFLRFESPSNLVSELKTTFWPLLTAGWKLWPFAHLITYGVIPVEQRLFWVDCIELIWVTILSTYSNENSESKISDISSGTDANP